jgi:lipase chaperone LimK
VHILTQEEELLQAVYRGHLGRELYRERLVEAEAHRRLAQVKRRRAALVFQALWRGYLFRNRRRIQARVVRLSRAALRVQRVYRGHLVRNDVNRCSVCLRC